MFTDDCIHFFTRPKRTRERNLQRHVLKWSGKGGWRAVKEAYRVGIRLAGDERILGTSEFVETTLKQAGEAYERKTRLQSAGMNLSALIAAGCRYLKVDEKELPGPIRRPGKFVGTYIILLL